MKLHLSFNVLIVLLIIIVCIFSTSSHAEQDVILKHPSTRKSQEYFEKASTSYANRETNRSKRSNGIEECWSRLETAFKQPLAAKQNITNTLPTKASFAQQLRHGRVHDAYTTSIDGLHYVHSNTASTYAPLQKKLQQLTKSLLGAEVYNNWQKFSTQYDKYITEHPDADKTAIDSAFPKPPVVANKPKTPAVKLTPANYDDWIDTEVRPYTSIILVSATNRYQPQCSVCKHGHTIWSELVNYIWDKQFTPKTDIEKNIEQFKQLTTLNPEQKNYPIMLFVIDIDSFQEFFQQYKIFSAPLYIVVPPSNGKLDPNADAIQFVSTTKYRYTPPNTSFKLQDDIFVKFLKPIITPYQQQTLGLLDVDTNNINHIKLLLSDMPVQKQQMLLVGYYVIVLLICYCCYYQTALINIVNKYLRSLLILSTMILECYFLSGPAKPMGLNSLTPSATPLSWGKRWNTIIFALLNIFNLKSIGIKDRSSSLQETYGLILVLFITALTVVILVQIATSYDTKSQNGKIYDFFKFLFTCKVQDNDNHMFDITEDSSIRDNNNNNNNNVVNICTIDTTTSTEDKTVQKDEQQQQQQKQSSSSSSSSSFISSFIHYIIANIMFVYIVYIIYRLGMSHADLFDMKYSWFVTHMAPAKKTVADLFTKYIYNNILFSRYPIIAVYYKKLTTQLIIWTEVLDRIVYTFIKNNLSLKL